MTLLQTPFVGVNDKTDYLRCGNVKVSDQLLRLRDQYESLLRFFLKIDKEFPHQNSLISKNPNALHCG